MIAKTAPIGFPEHNGLNKSFEIVALLIDHLKRNIPAIIFQCLFPFKTFCVRMNIMAVKKSHDIHTLIP